MTPEQQIQFAAEATAQRAQLRHEIEILPIDRLLEKQFPPGEAMLGSNLLDKSGALLISGPQKIGKSLFAAQLALCLANRSQFLGMAVGDATYRVLILQAEVSAKRMQQRFAKQVVGFSREAQSRVLNASVFSAIKLDKPEGLDLVKQWLDKHGPDLLIVDPLANFHTGDENEAQDMSRLTGALDDIRSRGIAVGLVHHHGKKSGNNQNVGHKARGSSVLPGWYDSHLSLERAESSIRVRFELRHDETPEDMVVKLNANTLLFETQTDDTAQNSLVIAAIRELGPVDAETVGRHCGKTRQWASDWLNRAVEQDKLVRRGTRPILYSLPGQPPETTVAITQEGVVVNTNTADGVRINGEAVNLA